MIAYEIYEIVLGEGISDMLAREINWSGSSFYIIFKIAIIIWLITNNIR